MKRLRKNKNNVLDLRELILDHRIDGVRLGDRESDVVAALGPPTDAIVQRRPRILCYGPIELGFDKFRGESQRTLRFITVYFGRGNGPPPALALTGWIPKQEISPQQVREQLAKIGVNVHFSLRCAPRECLVVQSGARITFNHDRLESIEVAQHLGQPEATAPADAAP